MKPNWFVGLVVPGDGWLEKVLVDVPETIKPFHKEDLHMTIAFFQAMDPTYHEPVMAVMDQIKSQTFEISLGKLLLLPSPKRASALSFGLEQGCSEVSAFMSQWREPLTEAAKAKPDQRDPLPHITVARPIRRFKEKAQADARVWVGQTVTPADVIQVSKLALYTWSEDRKSRQFQKIYEKPLN